MSRRDTIIIALLVNAGLLALLFMLAINIEEDPERIPQMAASYKAAGQEIAQTSIKTMAPPPAPVEQLDEEVGSFLKDLAKEEPTPILVVDEEGYVSIQPGPPVVVEQPVPSPSVETPPLPSTTKYVQVTVKRGDALEIIARNNGTTVEAIKKANHLTSNRLSIGQVLQVPVGASKSEPKEVAAVVDNGSSGAQYYTVKKGDNPWKIAKQFNVKFEDLLRMNNLDEERARNIKIGDKIRVK